MFCCDVQSDNYEYITTDEKLQVTMCRAPLSDFQNFRDVFIRPPIWQKFV